MHQRWGPRTTVVFLTLTMACALGGCRRHKTAETQRPQVPAQIGQRQAELQPTPAPQAETPVKPPCPGSEVHYSPQEDLEQIDAGLLSGANSEIEFTAYSFTDPKIAEVLEERAGEGVTVKIYTDRSSATEELSRGKGGEPVILELARTPNIQVRVKHSSTLAHMKAYEIDGRVLRTGSANFSANAERRQDNDLLILRDETAINSFRAKFDEMWDRPDNETIQ
jgi:phosphatidylserine/phosphatidylglycerophosphate/cardiolipin synthase-like enzyme